MKLINIYKDILKYAGLSSDDDGFISTEWGGKKEPTIVGGLRLVLPTRVRLKALDQTNEIMFHPLTENVFRSGESDVIQKLKLILNIRLNYTIGIVAQSLLHTLASPDSHCKLTPLQSNLLTVIKDIDQKTVQNFTNIMVAGLKNKAGRLFINTYLKKGGYLKGVKHSRVGIISFPFYEALIEGKYDKDCKEEKTLRTKDKIAYIAIFEFMFANIKDNEGYNYGSDSRVAPFLDSLLHSTGLVASELNDVINDFEEFIDSADSLLFDSAWSDHFINLESLTPEIRKIPVQFGNDGSVNIVEQPPIDDLVVIHQPMALPSPETVSNNINPDHRAIQPQQPTPTVQYPNNQPVAFQQQQPYYQQPARPDLKYTDGKLEWRSVKEVEQLESAVNQHWSNQHPSYSDPRRQQSPWPEVHQQQPRTNQYQQSPWSDNRQQQSPWPDSQQHSSNISRGRIINNGII
jgi:hypothetical protein